MWLVVLLSPLIAFASLGTLLALAAYEAWFFPIPEPATARQPSPVNARGAGGRDRAPRTSQVI
jgi:hypothetical protein